MLLIFYSIYLKTGAILEYIGRIDRNGYKYYASKQNCKYCLEGKGCRNKKNIE